MATWWESGWKHDSTEWWSSEPRHDWTLDATHVACPSTWAGPQTPSTTMPAGVGIGTLHPATAAALPSSAELDAATASITRGWRPCQPAAAGGGIIDAGLPPGLPQPRRELAAAPDPALARRSAAPASSVAELLPVAAASSPPPEQQPAPMHSSNAAVPPAVLPSAATAAAAAVEAQQMTQQLASQCSNIPPDGGRAHMPPEVDGTGMPGRPVPTPRPAPPPDAIVPGQAQTMTRDGPMLVWTQDRAVAHLETCTKVSRHAAHKCLATWRDEGRYPVRHIEDLTECLDRFDWVAYLAVHE